MDILKVILDKLPKVIETATFEAANIVVYTKDKEFFLKGEEKIREIVNEIKKRVELRAAKDLLVEKEKQPRK